jgi:signal transduction histidine kinase/ActR/RegA family two-component response regulator
MLIGGMIAQNLFLLGLPIFSAFTGGPEGVTPSVVILIAEFLYLAHLVLGLRQASRASQALRDAHALAEEQMKIAEAANHSKSAFLTTLSHEIRTPLNAVTSAAHLLKGTDLSAPQRDYVSILLNGGEVLLSLINDVLDMSKIEAGKLTVDMADVDLEDAADKVAALWGPKAAERGLKLDIQLDRTLPKVVRTDPLRLTQILSNLISNAVKFTSDGGVRVRIGPSRSPQKGAAGARKEALWFEVIDTGPGMTREVQGRLFQNFEQADAGVTVRFGGTGLGLAISRKLAELLGGSLTVESSPDHGSNFRLEIPLVAVAGERPEPVEARRHVDTSRALSILLAEDHAVNRKIVRLFLEPLGWDLTMVEDGAGAVAAANLRPFDLILMDMQMPVMSGVDAAAMISRGDGPNRSTPIVALTANAFDDQRLVWQDAGAVGFLTKPIDPRLLIETITKLAAKPTEDEGEALVQAGAGI